MKASKGLRPTEMKRVKQLQDENNKLRKLVGRSLPRQGNASGCDPPKAVRPWSQTRAGGAGLWGVERVDQAGVPDFGVRHVDLSLQVPTP